MFTDRNQAVSVGGARGKMLKQGFPSDDFNSTGGIALVFGNLRYTHHTVSNIYHIHCVVKYVNLDELCRFTGLTYNTFGYFAIVAHLVPLFQRHRGRMS